MYKKITMYIIAILLSSPIVANENNTLQQTAKQLKVTQSKQKIHIKNAKKLNTEIKKLRTITINIAKKNQQYEKQLNKLQNNIKALTKQRNSTKKKLQQKTQNLAGIIAVLQRLEKNPENAIMLYPGTPKEAIQSTAILKTLLPTIQNEKIKIQKQLNSLTQISNDLAHKKQTFQNKTKKLLQSKAILAKTINKKKKIQRKTLYNVKKLKQKEIKLSQKIKTIQDFLRQIEEKKQKEKKRNPILNKPLSIKTFPKKGYIKAPVVGKIIKYYNKSTHSQQKSTGIKIRTRPKTDVITPFDGYIAYAGKFGTLGKIIIISHHGGYNSVLIGIGTINVSAGQWVISGEPLGNMPLKKPVLHMQIRYGKKPINPLRWIQEKNFNRY